MDLMYETPGAGADSDELYQLLEELKGVRDRSQARVDGEDEEWEERKAFLYKKILTQIKSYKPEDPATKAVWIIGQIEHIAAELDQPRINLIQYEQLRTRYKRQTTGS